eukprot:scaffold198931_cov32-Attheya_sp.AAC.2
MSVEAHVGAGTGGPAFAGGHITMAVAELTLPTQETESDSDSDRLGLDGEQQSSTSSKRARSEAATNISVHGDAQPTTDRGGGNAGYQAANGSRDSEGNAGVSSGPGRRSICHKKWS